MQHIDWQIIERSLSDNLSEEEQRLLEDWLVSSDENRNYYSNVKSFHENKLHETRVDEEQVLQSWQRFTRVNQIGRKPAKYAKLTVRASVAAAIVLILSLTVWTRLFKVDDNPRTFLAGSSKAILTTSGGDVLELGNNLSVHQLHAEMIDEGRELNYQTGKTDTIHTIIYDRVQTPTGGEFRISLSDGTKVFMGPQSNIFFPVKFGDDERSLEIEGEFFFEVAKDTTRPFILRIEDMQITVLGTSFNVRAYKNEYIIETTLASGKIKLTTRDTSCYLLPGHQALFDKNEGVITSQEVDVNEFTSWKSGKLIARNRDFGTIMEQVKRWYGVDVVFEDTSVKNKRFYLDVDRYANLNTLLDIFVKTGEIHYQIKNQTVYITNAE